jgi:hypothetical protein
MMAAGSSCTLCAAVSNLSSALGLQQLTFQTFETDAPKQLSQLTQLCPLLLSLLPAPSSDPVGNE